LFSELGLSGFSTPPGTGGANLLIFFHVAVVQELKLLEVMTRVSDRRADRFLEQRDAISGLEEAVL
jgi:hypothetical protein